MKAPKSDAAVQTGLFTTADDATAAQFAPLLKPKKTFMLAACGPVMVTQLEQNIIDTPDFQRLRGVRQLGAAHLVYPTALHTRFDHSLGTLQMVADMIAKIRGNQHSSHEQRQITARQEILTRLYALLHDITHVPYGHSIEDELRLLERHDRNEIRINRFIGVGSRIGLLISEATDNTVIRDLLTLYRWDGKNAKTELKDDDAFIHDLVSNTVCADLLDYLRRDDFFCNLGMGTQYNFLNYLYIDSDILEDKQTGTKRSMRRVFVRLWKSQNRIPRRDVLTDLCGLLSARYKLSERVYFHHAKMIATAALGRSLQEHFTGRSQKDLEEWIVTQTDDTLIHELVDSTNTLAKELALGFRNRVLYLPVAQYSSEQIKGAQSGDHGVDLAETIEQRMNDPAQRRQIENLLAELVLCEPGTVLISAPTRKMNMKVAEMRVLWKGSKRLFREIDDAVVKPQLDVILDAHEKLWTMRLLCERSISEQKQNWVREAFETEVLTADPRQQLARRRELVRQVMEAVLIEENPILKGAEQDRANRINKAAEEVVSQLNYKAPTKAGQTRAIFVEALKRQGAL